MKLWIDDVRPAPNGYTWKQSVYGAMHYIMLCEAKARIYKNDSYGIKLIDIDHDAGDYSNQGGDYINLLNWLEETGRNYPIRLHSMNPVGVANMRAIIKRNGWIEIK